MVKSKELKEAGVIFYEGKKGESVYWQNLPNIQPNEARKERSALEQIGKDRGELWGNHPAVTSWLPAFHETRTGQEENCVITNALWKPYADVNEMKTDAIYGHHIHCQLQLGLVYTDSPTSPLLEEPSLPSLPQNCKFSKKKLCCNKKKWFQPPVQKFI